MRYLFTFLILICLSSSGCITSHYERRKKMLQQDIEILKLEVRKEKLENQLEELEKN